jgi:hypothetical protein
MFKFGELAQRLPPGAGEPSVPIRQDSEPAAGAALGLDARPAKRGYAIAGWLPPCQVIHVEILFAGFAQKRGPAFSLPGAGSIG